MDEAAHRSYRDQVSAQPALGRPGTAEEVAHSAVYLMENSFTTGITLDVDSGWQAVTERTSSRAMLSHSTVAQT
ncbi:hypothetical protein [Amycolatopsis sp. FDAARGOS 1241]|uniref:hypothetical protein n=1 Tax=Amycolatopsis sp. FDAARGOS 1241 TaxID=2778070 RepID=UPI00195030CB|nr:hypothetical protein I6J71_25510 [Amycolatopsis sp. FDAARGOS 1241]